MSGDLATPGADALLNGGTYPSTLYVQLHNGNPGTNGTSNVHTTSVRKSFTLSAAQAGAAGYRQAYNDALIEWLNASVTGPSEDVTHVSIWDASVAGVCWHVDDCVNATVESGNTISIDAGTLIVNFPVWT